jgi:hypothetical protein
MSIRVPTTQDAVLLSIVDRLRKELSLNESTCFLSVSPEASPTVDQNLWLTVSPEDGMIDDAAWSGAGQAALIEHTFVVVTIFSAMRLDRPQHSVSFLTDSARGVLVAKRNVLKALAGFDPLNVDGDMLLCEPLTPTTCPRPLNDRQRIGDVQLWFSTVFQWDMTSR